MDYQTTILVGNRCQQTLGNKKPLMSAAFYYSELIKNRDTDYAKGWATDWATGVVGWLPHSAQEPW